MNEWTWDKVRAELREELTGAGHADVWHIVDTYSPRGSDASKYQLTILYERLYERLGSAGVDALAEAVDRIDPRPDEEGDA